MDFSTFKEFHNKEIRIFLTDGTSYEGLICGHVFRDYETFKIISISLLQKNSHVIKISCSEIDRITRNESR